MRQPSQNPRARTEGGKTPKSGVEERGTEENSGGGWPSVFGYLPGVGGHGYHCSREQGRCITSHRFVRYHEPIKTKGSYPVTN